MEQIIIEIRWCEEDTSGRIDITGPDGQFQYHINGMMVEKKRDKVETAPNTQSGLKNFVPDKNILTIITAGIAK